MGKYTISQKVNLNGASQTRSMNVTMSLDEVTAFVSHLEGKVTVKEVVLEAGSDALVSEGNFIGGITMIANSDNGSQTVRIQSYDQRAIIFKKASSTDDIATVLYTTKPFGLLPTATPDVVSLKDKNRTPSSPAV
jgi:hypothetical protein